ncbi:hypothetical protein AQPE_4038 [Aquipluma nitroreducens]|jgi:hypothetical protein|uniref:Uncharacterized protein n=1 Tax=Aquipluma nitroreducens TaxID=2010828 RepID=A0A5K7SE56_9BACT|nr:hypothetical protein [Aquipluma nitroreducens]BBE19850.1 hypothetical protein AQPE_4038 [Aquipluma nitroreducens]
MKQTIKITAIALMLCLSVQLFAQHEKEIKNSEVEGLFLTLSDFQNGKLTRPTDMQHKGDKIKLKQFFISPDIISVEQEKETVFYKDSIFAIRLTNGENYRFINRTPCLIADTSSLYIYTYKTTKTVYIQSGRHNRAKSIPVTNYYYSTGKHSEKFKLTLENIRKNALPDPYVHVAVCNKFITDEMLTKFNPQTGRFELNEIILSLTQKN